MKEIGSYHLHAPQKLLFLECAKHRQAVGRTDVHCVRAAFAPEQGNSLTVSGFRALVGLHDRKESEMRSKQCEAGCKSAQLLCVVEGGQLAGNGSDTRWFLQPVGEQLGRKRTACISINRHASDSTTVRRIAGYTDQGDALSNDAADHVSKFVRTTRSKQNAVIMFGCRGFERLEVS